MLSQIRGTFREQARRPQGPTTDGTEPDDHLDTHQLSTTVNGLKATLQFLKEGPDGVAGGGIKTAASMFLAILEIVENVKGNVEEARVLDLRLATVWKRIIEPLKLATATSQALSTDLVDRVTRLEQELETLKSKIVPLRDRGVLARTANHAADKEVLNVLNVHLDRIISMFTLEEIMATSVNGEQLRSDVSDIKTQVIGLSHRPPDTHLYPADTADEVVIHRLPRAKARYDSSLRRGARRCLQGTRTALLELLHLWIDGTIAPDKPIFWLSGEAGTGKSTIAHTIAEDRDAANQLGASFFFSRNEEARKDANLFISTLAAQLALFNDEYKGHLAAVLRNDPSVLEGNIKKQLKRLILEPLGRTTTLAAVPIVIVVDALDECSPDEGAEEILEAWAELIKDFPMQFRLLITSRPSWHIKDKISSSEHLSTAFHLHDISISVVEEDIRLYLRSSLAGIHDGWPPARDLELLTSRVRGLFVLASTYSRYIKDPCRGDPRGQLQALLSQTPTLGASPVAELDKLYLDIVQGIQQASASDQRSVAQAFQTLVGAILVVGIPMSPIQLSNLLGMALGDVRYILGRLSSAIYLPDDNSPMSFFHPSFSEFLSDPERCTNPLYLIDKSQAHMRMATVCLDIFDTHLQDNVPDFHVPEQPTPKPAQRPFLRRIFSTRDPVPDFNQGEDNTQESEIPEALSLTTSKAYPDYLCYACVYFAYHLGGIHQGDQENGFKLLKHFEAFYERSILRWLEVITSLNDIPGLDDLPLRLHTGLINYYQRHKQGSREIMTRMASLQQHLKAESDDFDMVETPFGEDRNGAKGISLWQRGVVDRYRLAISKR